MPTVSRQIAGVLKDADGSLMANLEFRISALSPFGSDGTLVGTIIERITTNVSGAYTVNLLTLDAPGAFVTYQCQIGPDTFQFDLVAGSATSLDELYNLGVVAGSSSAATLAELISGKADQADLDALEVRVDTLEGSAPSPDISFSAAHPANNTYDGFTITGLNNLGGVDQWDAVTLNASSQWIKADADGSDTYPARGLALATVLTGNATSVLVQGTVRHDTWNWIPNGNIYMSDTPGGLTQTDPATSGDRVQVVGFALSADVAYFDFSRDMATVA